MASRRIAIEKNQPFGFAKSWTWSGGPVQTRAFDLDGRQTSYPYSATGTVNLTYDLGNRIKNLTGTVAKIYGYDKLDRLTSYSNEIYAYDADGNRSSHTVGATNYPYTYPSSSNRLTSFTGPAARSYTYDSSGNTLTTSSGYAFTYDARGRMTNITAGSVNQYGINALGQRLTQAGTGYTGTQRYVYSEEGKLLGEYDNTGAMILEHVYLNDTPLAVLKGTGAYLVQADHLNTPRAILGAANALVWKWDSDAFGTTAANENPSALGIFNYNLRFPGQYYDKESTFHYNYFRDYNPKTGRYIESDPIGLAGGINPYAYVDSNPVIFYDDDGLAKKKDKEPIVIAPTQRGGMSGGSGGDFRPMPFPPPIRPLTGRFCESPSQSPMWKNFLPYQNSIKTNGLKGKDKQFYQWDNTHGDIEVYDRNGNHMGSMNPQTGDMHKPAVPGRTIDK